MNFRNGWIFMKKKTKVIAGVVVLVLVILVGSLVGFAIKRNNDHFSASLTFGCDVQKYEKKSDTAYLTFEYEFSDKKLVKSIAMSENQTELISSQNVKDIIGIQVIMNIPQKEIQSHHLDTKNPNLAWFLFEEGKFDNYCKIVDVSFKSTSR